MYHNRMPTLSKPKENYMLRESYNLYRHALSQILTICPKVRLPQKLDINNWYDLETPSGLRIDVKACRMGERNKSRHVRFSINNDKRGAAFRDRIDILVGMAYDENMNLVTVLCIPAAKIPEWDTTINISIAPSRVQRSNPWYQYVTTLEELKDKLK